MSSTQEITSIKDISEPKKVPKMQKQSIIHSVKDIYDFVRDNEHNRENIYKGMKMLALQIANFSEHINALEK